MNTPQAKNKIEVVDGAEDQKPDPNILILTNPVQFGSELIAELHFKPLFGKALRGLPLEMKMDDMYTLASKSCGYPPSVFDRMCLADAMEAITKVGNFIGRGLATGDKASE